MMAATAPVKVFDRVASLANRDEPEESSSSHAPREIPIELLVKVSERQKKRTTTRALTKARGK